MENKTGFTGARKAIIEAISSDGTYTISFQDDNSLNPIPDVPVMNVGSFSSGIFTKYHIGATVWVLQSYYYQPVIIGFADMPGSIEQANILETNDQNVPQRDSGEIVIQASSGAHIDLRNSGDIKLSNLTNDGVHLSSHNRSLLFTSPQSYTLNDSGYTIEGRVRRFHPSYVPGNDPVYVDLIADPEADTFMVDVSRDPTQKALPMNRARGFVNVIRNPSFAEKREMILEFADSFFVRDPQTEVNISAEFPQTLDQMSRSIAHRRGYGQGEQDFDDMRHSTRANLLKLDNNVIVERVQGTLVDFFGNVLDLNYNKLDMPKLVNSGKSAIGMAHQLLNRSVAYHFQVNTRNTLLTGATGSNRFTFDVDKEGQFKLNVPASSSAGTIPTITTFINNETDLAGRTDIVNTQLSRSNIASPTGGNAGTAFHDMTTVASRAIAYSLQTINPILVHDNTISIQQTNGTTPNIEFLMNSTTSPSDIPNYTTTISVMNGDPAISSTITSNLVGGRSGQINMEGSLEMSIGKDAVDNKSLTLDLGGSMVSWFGTDNNGRSLVADFDGEVILNVGDYITDSNGDQNFNKGSLTIRVNLVDQNDEAVGQLQPGETANNKTTSDHVIHISPQGIVISSGNGTPIVLRSSGDLLMEAAGAIDLKAKEIRVDSGVLRRIQPKKGDL